VQGSNSRMRVSAVGLYREECKPKANSVDGFVMDRTIRVERGAGDLHCAGRVDNLCSRKNLQQERRFYLRSTQRNSCWIAHPSHFESLN